MDSSMLKAYAWIFWEIINVTFNNNNLTAHKLRKECFQFSGLLFIYFACSSSRLDFSYNFYHIIHKISFNPFREIFSVYITYDNSHEPSESLQNVLVLDLCQSIIYSSRLLSSLTLNGFRRFSSSCLLVS